MNFKVEIKENDFKKMDNEKVLELVDRIEADLRELAKITGEDHISAWILNNHFTLTSFVNETGQTVLNFFREGGADNAETA